MWLSVSAKRPTSSRRSGPNADGMVTLRQLPRGDRNIGQGFRDAVSEPHSSAAMAIKNAIAEGEGQVSVQLGHFIDRRRHRQPQPQEDGWASPGSQPLRPTAKYNVRSPVV